MHTSTTYPPIVLLSVLLLALGAGCSAAGSGGDAPTRTRGMRLPPRAGMEAGMEATSVPREPMASAKVAMAPGKSTGPGPGSAPGSAPGMKPSAGVPTTAADRLRAVLKLKPQDHDTRLKLARLLQSTGDVAAAETELRRLLAVGTHAQAARVLLVRLLRAVYRLQEAVKLGKAHVVAHPKDVEGRKQLGLAYLAWRVRQAAAYQLQQALKLAPKRADLWRTLGYIYLKWRRLKKAVAALKQAVRLAPQNPWPQTLLGDAYWGMSRLGTAERAYRKAAGLTGGPPVFRAVALDKLGTLLVQQRKRKTARSVHDACKKMFPTLGCPYTRAALLPPNPVRMPAMRPVATY